MLNIDPLAPAFQILTCFNRGRKCKIDPHANSCWGRTHVDTLRCKSNSVKWKSVRFLFVDVTLCNPQLVEQMPCEFTVHISVELKTGQLMKGFRAYIINDSRFSPCHIWREWQTLPLFSALKKEIMLPFARMVFDWAYTHIQCKALFYFFHIVLSATFALLYDLFHCFCILQLEKTAGKALL